MAKASKTAEETFLACWEEYGYNNSDLIREHQFYSGRRWRFDFAFPASKVAIEIDGRGRHQTVTGVRNDCEKHNMACLLGWCVLHFPATDILCKNEWGESRLEIFIEILCLILSQRSTQGSDDKRTVQEGME